MKTQTLGVDPKVPIQLFVTLLVAVAAHYGINLDAETSGALAVVLGAGVAALGPAAKTVAKPDQVRGP